LKKLVAHPAWRLHRPRQRHYACRSEESSPRKKGKKATKLDDATRWGRRIYRSRIEEGGVEVCSLGDELGFVWEEGGKRGSKGEVRSRSKKDEQKAAGQKRKGVH